MKNSQTPTEYILRDVNFYRIHPIYLQELLLFLTSCQLGISLFFRYSSNWSLMGKEMAGLHNTNKEKRRPVGTKDVRTKKNSKVNHFWSRGVKSWDENEAITFWCCDVMLLQIYRLIAGGEKMINMWIPRTTFITSRILFCFRNSRQVTKEEENQVIGREKGEQGKERKTCKIKTGMQDK